MSFRKRGVFRSKKANIMQEVYFLTFEIILLVIVGLALLQFEQNYAKGFKFAQLFVTADYAMYMTSIYGVNGVVEALYEIPDSEVSANWKIILDKGVVSIKDGMQPLITAFPYSQDRNIDEFSDSFTETIQLYKTGEEIKTNLADANLRQLRCPRIITNESEGWKNHKILVTYGKHVGQATEQVIDERTLVKQITNAPPLATDIAANPNIFTDPKSDAEIAVFLHVSHHEETANALRAYVKSDSQDQNGFLKSKKLACYILNNILTKDAIYDFVQIVPVDKHQILQESNELQDLNDYKIAIAIEAGNSETAQAPVIANGISQGIKKYFTN